MSTLPVSTWSRRTHTCGALRRADAGSTVVLNGWVHRRRDQGGLIFVDLRDRYGITQVVINRDDNAQAHEAASGVRSEYVLAVTGQVRERPAGTTNPDLDTGEIEVGEIERVEILAASQPPPFEITSDRDIDESVRLTHRYLDLRRIRMRELTELRFNISRVIREHLWERDFLELETPTLVKSTPEGARDFIVPSRHYPGQAYALPQSPQQLKQLLMVAGLDRYFQLARCYRDEDLRADRTAEFTQLDIEMAFVEREDILELIETLYLRLARELSTKRLLQEPFPRITYADAMERYGTDKADLRFGLELVDVSHAAAGHGFRVFDQVVQSDGVVKAVVAPGSAAFTRREVDRLQDVVKANGAAGLATIALNSDGTLRSPLARFFGDDALRELARAAGAEQGDLVCLVADKRETANAALGELRLALGEKLDLIDPDVLAFGWIIDFPLFEPNEETGGLTFSHNPFCSPADDSFDLLYTDPAKATAKQYDLVCNGHEIGGGSIRAHRAKDLHRIYQVMGFDEDSIQEQIGHMLQAFEYGAPPHGGIAMGLDRIAMIFGDTANLRDVTVFPKNQAGVDLMLQSPSPIDSAQMKELGFAMHEANN
ncbi:MAG: aspartate--tRNA ligase [Chloroflexi bacterium]|nr:aspartate--tRNA ligase [Chloroflexota bacterium]